MDGKAWYRRSLGLSAIRRSSPIQMVSSTAKDSARSFSDFTDKLNHTIPARPGTGCTHSKRDNREEGKVYKANNIRECDLGYQKKDKVRHKAQAALASKVNNASTPLYAEKPGYTDHREPSSCLYIRTGRKE